MKHVFLVALAALARLAVAQTSASDLAIQELSRCDGTFFSALHARRAALEKAAAMSSVGSVSTFVVADRRHPARSRVLFSKPIELHGLRFVGFFDEVADIPDGMTSYSWGYLVAGSVATAATALQPLVWESSRLRSDGPVFVRSELWSHETPAQGWTRVETEAGVPKRRTVERVFLVEPYDGENAFIRVGCSIQGNVTDPLLRELRPDLRPK